MPRFAANIGDGWLYSNLPFLNRIGAAAKDDFTAVECGVPYAHDPYEIKKELDKYNMKFVLLNTDSMPNYTKRNDGRKYHGIYSNEKDLFKKTILRAYKYGMILNCNNIHIDTGVIDYKLNLNLMRNILISNLKIAQSILDNDINNEYFGNNFNLMIEPVNNISGRGINNYYLWSQYDALSIINDVNNNYSGNYPIYLQYDFYHSQTHHGDIITFLKNNIKYIRHIQVSQCPNRNEPCNQVLGDLNYNQLYKYLDDELKYKYYVGLEYHPTDSNNTTKGLQLNNWFNKFNTKTFRKSKL